MRPSSGMAEDSKDARNRDENRFEGTSLFSSSQVFSSNNDNEDLEVENVINESENHFTLP